MLTMSITFCSVPRNNRGVPNQDRKRQEPGSCGTQKPTLRKHLPSFFKPATYALERFPIARLESTLLSPKLATPGSSADPHFFIPSSVGCGAAWASISRTCGNRRDCHRFSNRRNTECRISNPAGGAFVRCNATGVISETETASGGRL